MTPQPQQRPVVTKQNGFLLFILDDGYWRGDGAIFQTKEEALQEIKAMANIMPAAFAGVKYSIIPNDGICQGAYRPLDYGDMILTGKPKGEMQEVFTV